MGRTAKTPPARAQIHRPAPVVIALAGFVATLGVAIPRPAARAAAALALTSPAFTGQIPARFTCTGADFSPAISWSGVPQAAKSLALVLEDPDAPSGDFVHWIVFNLPPNSHGLPEGLKAATISTGAQGRNDFGKIGYNGPCPPPGPPHHYRLTLYALSRMLALHAPSAAELATAMHAAVLESAQLTATLAR